MPVAIELMPDVIFRAALQQVVGAGDPASSRLCRLLADPRSPSRLLRRFAQRVHVGACEFTGLLASLAATAPDEAARGVILQNLLAEEGIVVQPGKGAMFVPELRHRDWSARFARACGVTDLDRPVGPSLNSEMLALSRDPRRWLCVVAYFLVGQESAFARVCAAFGVALERRGMGPGDLVFFTRHAVDDQQHGSDALDLVLQRATTPESQQQVLEAARRGVGDLLAHYG